MSPVDPVPGRLAIGITILVALAAITPYVRDVPQNNLQLVSNAQTNLFAGWLMMIAFYFKSRGDAVKDSIIATQSDTAKLVATASAPSGEIVLKEGQQVTTTATDAGTLIQPTPPRSET